MAFGDRWIAKAKAAAEKRTGEEVVQVTTGSRPGAMGALVGGEVAGLAFGAGGGRAPGAKIVRENGKETRLPTSFLLVLTPARLHVFKYRSGWFGVKIKQELGVFERDGLVVDVRDGKLTKRFTLHSPAAGQTMAFEMNRHRVTNALADELQ